MSKNSPTSPFLAYVAECVRLLYWTYFKPYTFDSWLRDIHPELRLNQSPFTKRSEFRTNEPLRRYARQLWWLKAVVPILTALLVGLAYTVSGKSSYWFPICFVSLARLISCLLARRRIIFVLFMLIYILFMLIYIGSIMMYRPDTLSFLLALNSADQGRRWLAADPSDTVSEVYYNWSLMDAMELYVVVEGLLVFLWSIYGTESYSRPSIPILEGVLEEGIALGVVSAFLWNSLPEIFPLMTLGDRLGMVWSMKMMMFLYLVFFRFLRLCFWLLELLWTLTLHFLTRQSHQALALQYLPSRFDERIILPLPFMGQMIVEAYRENPCAARETIDYLITSTNQKNVAAQAMVGIAVDSLDHCQKLGDIVDITEELAWIPSPPPKQLGLVLPQLLDISQSVQVSVQATSLYRQSELLNRPISALRELSKTLVFAKNARLATSFGSIAKRWLTILETAQCTLQEQAQYSTEIRQVYIAGNALDPLTAKNRFKGRIDLFREIERLALEEPPPVLLLYGGRRTGKTSTLKYLPQQVGASLVPLLVDVQGAASATTLSGLAENLATQIIEAARQLPRRIDLPYPDKNKLDQDPFPALQDWLGELERTTPSKRFLLCLDEFERLSEVVEATGSKTPLNFLRNVLQHRASWTLLFSGSHEPKELPDYWSDYLINTRTLRVSYLDEKSARELIVQPVEDFTNIYDHTAVDSIIHLTRCQPYLVQLTCYEVVELLNRDIRGSRRDASNPKATARDVETVIPIVLERGGEYFRELWRSLSDRARNLLQRLVQGETPAAQDKAVLRKLERKEILEKTESGYSFQVPLVQNYVEQVVEEEE